MWDNHSRLEGSPFMAMSFDDIEMLAVSHGGRNTWIAGGGHRANGKLQGLRWPALRDCTIRYDQE